jgi:hypothetical protein
MPSPSLFTGTSRSLWMEQSKLLYIYIKSKEYEDKAHMKFIILRYIFQEKIFKFILYFTTFICFRLK